MLHHLLRMQVEGVRTHQKQFRMILVIRMDLTGQKKKSARGYGTITICTDVLTGT